MEVLPGLILPVFRLSGSVLFGLLLLAGFLPMASASSPDPSETKVVRVYYPDIPTRNRILISFESALLETRYEEGYHLLEATEADVEKLEAVGLVVKDDPLYFPRTRRLPGYSCYETVEETFASAQAMASSRPDLAEWTDIGNSWEKESGLGGYDIMALKLTQSSISADKPKLLVTCALHAREYTTAALCLDFAEYLVEGYETDPDATWLLDHHEIHFVLQANPDGRKKAESGLFWRKNTNQAYCGVSSNFRGADLNRNFPFEWACCGGSSGNACANDYRGATPSSEPEVSALVDYARSIFVDQRGADPSDPAPLDATGIAIDVHSYGELWLWPWGYTTGLAPNSDGLQTLGRKLGYWNGYWPEQAVGLYPTDGASDDFFYGDLGIAAFTVELGTEFFEACSVYESSIMPSTLPSLIYAAKVARAPYQTPSGPDVVSALANPSTALWGEELVLSAEADDARYNQNNGVEATQDLTAAEYYVDTPPWAGGTAVAMLPADGAFNSSYEVVNASLQTSDYSLGRHIVFVRARDAEGNWGAMSSLFITIQAPPMVPALSLWARLALVLALLSGGFARVYLRGRSLRS
ncbi:MAG: M14 family zinc carboxypeptidase [Myxococcota bacterium]|nr:M14 family zinc carboxypeptidase [Myxococcota bacterium]